MDKEQLFKDWMAAKAALSVAEEAYRQLDRQVKAHLEGCEGFQDQQGALVLRMDVQSRRSVSLEKGYEIFKEEFDKIVSRTEYGVVRQVKG